MQQEFKNTRKILFLSISIFLGIGTLFAIIAIFIFPGKYGNFISFITSPYLTLFLAPIAIAVLYLGYQLNNNSLEELKPLIEERKDINRRINNETKREDVIDTIRLGLNQLTEYYVINKSQAKSSFFLSLFAIVVGLLTLIFGIGIFYLQHSQNLQLTAITSISGTLLEFIGGAYFFVYRKSIEQMNLYFIQLVKMQDTMLAVKLTQDLPIPERQVDITEKIILGLLERSSKIVLAISNAPDEVTKKQNRNNHVSQGKIKDPTESIS